MLALTEVAPWGSAIMRSKWIENRSWAPPHDLVGKRFAVHQGKTVDAEAILDVQGLIPGFPSHGHPLGAFLGTVLLFGFVQVGPEDRPVYWRSWRPLTGAQMKRILKSEWRNPEASHLWLLKDPRPLDEPLPCRGMQKLWAVPAEYLPALEALGKAA